MAGGIVALVVGVVFVALIILLVPDLRGRIKRIAFGPTGLSIEFFEQAAKQKQQPAPDPRELRRHLKQLPRQARLLWVDDRPENNLMEVQAFQALGWRVTTARTNAEARQLWAAGPYDAVVSDIGRQPPEVETAGLELPRLLPSDGKPIPLVYYVGRAEEPTAGGCPVVDTPSALVSTLATALAVGRQPELPGRR